MRLLPWRLNTYAVFAVTAGLNTTHSLCPSGWLTVHCNTGLPPTVVACSVFPCAYAGPQPSVPLLPAPLGLVTRLPADGMDGVGEAEGVGDRLGA